MALTNIEFVLRTMVADRYVNIVEFDFDNNYPPDGEALTDANLGLNDDNLIVLCFPRLGYVPEYDHAAQKIKVFYGDNNNASDGPAVEVADTTNLSTLTNVRVIAIGKKPA